MCTLAWRQAGEELWACFNRDEQRSRPIAEAPEIHQLGNHECIYARDPVGGGTWFAVSDAGFAVALLNHYPAEAEVAGKPPRSRGNLVLELAGAESLEAALHRLERKECTAYAPFYLFLLSPERVGGYAWNGIRMSPVKAEGSFWTSSSFRPEEVAQWRRALWKREFPNGLREIGVTGEWMRQPYLDLPTHGVTMDREKTRTVSQIELAITQSGIEFRYYERAGSGLAFREAEVLQLPLAR